MTRLFEKLLQDAETVGLVLLGTGLTLAFITMVLPDDSKALKHTPDAYRTRGR